MRENSRLMALIKKHSKAAQQVLLKAINDTDREVRLLAINAFVDDDAKRSPAQAMANEPRTFACGLLPLRQARRRGRVPRSHRVGTPPPEPQLKERVSDRLEVTELALPGLGELGNPRALSIVVPLTDSPHARASQGGCQCVCGWRKPTQWTLCGAATEER